MHDTTQENLTLSIIIPVYNEEGILAESLTELMENLEGIDFSYEIIIAENGSTDDTVALAEGFASKYDQVSTFSADTPRRTPLPRHTAPHKPRGT